jgi:hypothetical protein
MAMLLPGLLGILVVLETRAAQVAQELLLLGWVKHLAAAVLVIRAQQVQAGQAETVGVVAIEARKIMFTIFALPLPIPLQAEDLVAQEVIPEVPRVIRGLQTIMPLG